MTHYQKQLSNNPFIKRALNSNTKRNHPIIADNTADRKPRPGHSRCL